jgi:hypothetical protein
VIYDKREEFCRKKPQNIISLSQCVCVGAGGVRQGLTVFVILLPWPPEYWDYRHIPPLPPYNSTYEWEKKGVKKLCHLIITEWNRIEPIWS